MEKNGLLTVSQFSKLIKQTPQAVYKQFNNKLKDYVTKDYLRNELDKNTINWLNI